MKRDMALVREILVFVEAQPAGELIQDVSVNCDDKHVLAEHIRLMIQAGLLDGEARVDREQGSHVLIEGLTWEGNDFLAAIRNDTVWNRLLAKAKEIGVAMTLELAKELGKKYLRELAGLPGK